MATLSQDELVIAAERITPQWLAGFFDGEGSICIVRQRGLPSLAINLTQADFHVLHIISVKFGGELIPRIPQHRKKCKLAKKKNYLLQYGGKSALPLLEAMRPYVVLKRKLVEWAIEMAKLHTTPGGNRRWGKGMLPPEVRKRREQIYESVRTENKAGRLPTVN